jgi:hypothetical protein
MHNPHKPKQADGFAKYRARHSRPVRPSLLLLPPARRRALQRNLIFIGLSLGVVLLMVFFAKAHAAGGAYVVDDGAINAPGECNVDAWHTANRHAGDTHDETLSPACTFNEMQSVQWEMAWSPSVTARKAATRPGRDSTSASVSTWTWYLGAA